jgi:hypothetical protein
MKVKLSLGVLPYLQIVLVCAAYAQHLSEEVIQVQQTGQQHVTPTA